jgi:transcriptional regulator
MGGLKETVLEVSDGFLKDRQRRRAKDLRAQGLNFTQIAEAMGTTLLHVNKMMHPDPDKYKTQKASLELRRILLAYERLAIEGLKLKARGLSIHEICVELRTRRDALLRAFAMAEEQGWDVKAREGKQAD